jgi:hypothetical protein
MADDLLFVYRPLSQILQIAVLPDIHARVANGSLDRTSLPLELHQFRWISGAQGSVVEVNNQFQVPIMVTAKRPTKAGEAVTLADIDPEACALAPATQGGRLAAYFVYIRQFLNLLVLFDFSANNPFGGADDQPVPLRFPLQDYLSTGQLLQSHPPLDMLAKLEARNWPPAPAYYPSAIPYLLQTDANVLEDAITDVYNWESRTDWHRVVCFQRLGESALGLYKGDQVFLSGSLVTTKYDRQVGSGKKATTLKLTSWQIRANVLRKLNRAAKEPEATASGSQNESDNVPF